MSFFHKKTSASRTTAYPPGEFKPVLRVSICTGEKTACMQNRKTGKLTELMLIRNETDLADFLRTYGIEKENLETVY